MQNIRTTTKFLSSLIKNIKHFSQEKNYILNFNCDLDELNS